MRGVDMDMPLSLYTGKLTYKGMNGLSEFCFSFLIIQ